MRRGRSLAKRIALKGAPKGPIHSLRERALTRRRRRMRRRVARFAAAGAALAVRRAIKTARAL